MRKTSRNVLPTIVVNGIIRKATVVKTPPVKSVKIDVKDDFYDFYEVIEKDGEDSHYWTYAVIK